MNWLPQHAGWAPKDLVVPILTASRRMAVLLVLATIFVARASAAVHPVPLAPNTDAAKCLECHNNDDSRESGGSSPNGPHGSKNSHILERQYPFAQAPAPGQPIPSQYLYPNPDLGPTGAYALCAKCHNLNNLDQSWNEHLFHVNSGFSCSICHTPHGMGSTSASISGQRLVNFDINVVAPNGATPITYSYNAGNESCTLTCHGQGHNGSMTATKGRGKGRR